MAKGREDTPLMRATIAHGRISRAGGVARDVLFIIVLTALVLYGLSQVTLLVFPVLIALILAAAITPFIRWLRKRSWSSSNATALAFVVLIVIFGSAVVAVIAATRAQWDKLADQTLQRSNEVFSWLQHGPLQVKESTLGELRSSTEDFFTTRDAGQAALDGLLVISQVATGFVLIAVVLFFFLKDGRMMWEFFLRLLPRKNLAKTRLIGIRTIEILGGYVRATAIIAAVDALLIGLTLLILQVPLAWPLAVLIFVGAFIPVLGATVTGIIAALVTLVSNDFVDALIVAVVIVAVNQLEGQLLQPVVMGRTLAVHPLVVLSALTAGAILGGIMGAILVVPMTAVGWAMLKIWIPQSNNKRARAVDI